MALKHVTIKLPIDTITEIDKLVGRYGYTSRAEVVKSALRTFFEKYPETQMGVN